MESTETKLIGVGIYTVTEAARLTGISAGRIRRWLRGYTFRSGDRPRRSAPVWQGQLPPSNGLALGFLDLLEVRFVETFLRHGVSWPIIRKAETRGRERFGTIHPFATRGFQTDGRKIFARISDEESIPALLDVADSQLAFHKMISPSLAGIQFDDDAPVRWWPLGQKRQVVIDPKRSFGQPIVNREGVPTAVLATAFEVEGSEEAVAKWYEVNVRSVRDAVEFEKRLAA